MVTNVVKDQEIGDEVVVFDELPLLVADAFGGQRTAAECDPLAAYANGMDEIRMERSLEDDYLSRRSQSFQTSCLHPKNDDEGERLGEPLTIVANIRSWCSSIWV